MFLHEMTVAQRLESIVHIASKLAGAPAHAAFVAEWPDLITAEVACDLEAQSPTRF